MGTYLASSALDRLGHVQAELERHLIADTDGRCRDCGQPEPCDVRRALLAVVARYGSLPRRPAGATIERQERAEPPCAGVSWFGQRSATASGDPGLPA